ncbi:MAG: DNA polymerase IV [Candidatus Aenigmarchaeota archaeon]|nr:DNA polymerase IV [Candidatus Aenigmarchaeota archaeon]
MQRIIFHIDMDAFFPSIEQREHPEYRNMPVIVGADPKKGRGVVSSPSYEARKFGIKSGMPISKAWKLCPQAMYLPVNFRLYEKVSSRIINILRKYAEKFEQVSIDECYLDVSKKVKGFEEAKELAFSIKKEILEKEVLTCSIGIAPNKLVAKIASDFQKPDGLTLVKPEEVKNFISPLPVDKIPGIGRKTKRALEEMKIKTIGELAKTNVSLLTENFGKIGIYFHLAANGIDESEVEEEYEVKSIGREHTFEKDTEDVNLIHRTLEELAGEVYEEVKASNYMFKTVTIKVRYEDFETHTHAKTLNFFTDMLGEMVKIGKELLEPFLYSERRIRLIGIRVSKLSEMKVTKLRV